MEEPKRKWIEKLDAKALAQKENQKKQRIKEAAQNKIAGDIKRLRAAMYKGMKLQTTDGKKTTEVLDYVNMNQTETTDVDDFQDGVDFVNGDEDFALLLGAQHIVDRMAAELEEGVDDLDDNGDPILDVNGKPKKVKLYDENDKDGLKKLLKEELYEPMLRQGVLAETFIPDEFSSVKEMIEGAFEEYGDRVKEDYGGPGAKAKIKQFFKENLAVGNSLIELGVSVGVATESTIAALGKLNAKPPTDPSEASKYKIGPYTDNWAAWKDPTELAKPEVQAEIVAVGLELFAETDELVMEDPGETVDFVEGEGQNVKDKATGKAGQNRANNAVKVGKIAAGPLAAEISEKLKAAGLGMAAATTFQTKAKMGALVKALAAEVSDKEKVKTAEELVKAAGAELAAAFAETMAVLAAKLTDPLKADLIAAGKTMAETFKNELAGKAKVIVKELEKEDDTKIDYAKIMVQFVLAAQAATKAGLPATLTTRLDDVQVKLKVNAAAGEAAEKQMVEDMQKADEQAKAEQLELEEAEAKGDIQAKAGIIQRKINSLKRKRQLLKWGSGLAGIGIELASQALAPLALAGSILKISMALREAIIRHTDLSNFVESKGDMVRAVCAFQHALTKFIDNAAMQALHYDMKATIELIKMIGIIVECTGFPAAMAAGKVIQATAGVAAAMENAIYEVNKRINLEQAWTSYKVALLRPDNRRLALIAISKNDTLAKYAAAYGAVIMKDPLVSDFVSYTGLDERALRDPKASVKKVVEYFEARFPDDNEVTGRMVVVSEWAPKPIELTAVCWAGAKQRGKDKAGLLMKEDKTIDANLMQFEAAFADAQKKAENKPAGVTVKEVEECLGLLETVESGLHGCTPKRKVGDAQVNHRDMQDVIDAFLGEVASHKLKVEAWRQIAV